MNPLKNMAVKILNAGKGLMGKPENPVARENITIGITTFEARFDRYFVPLLKRIRECTNNEIVVAVNGENNRAFGEKYRSNILKCMAEYENVYPVFFPRFRGLSKLWNSIVIHATHDHVLMLNDDIMIENPNFMNNVSDSLSRNEGKTFLINRSWSHFLINREELDALGYFDERLLGIGEEDGDMTWRYIKQFGEAIPSFKIKGFQNFAEETVRSYKPVNIQTHSGTKYSQFNRKFIHEEKYSQTDEGIRGMFDTAVVLKDPGENQYPYERFYRHRREEL
ncbi:MAG: glycosyltransferase family 2 protein [Pseudomonadota bacterium]